MPTDPLTGAGEILRPALDPLHAAQGRELTAVVQMDSDAGESIALVFDGDALYLDCNADSDTLALRFGPAVDLEEADDLTADSSWSRFIGKELFWGWLTINQQGRCDGALLSFDGVVPEIGVNVVASAFETLEIRQRAG